jgi:hypothetical protein
MSSAISAQPKDTCSSSLPPPRLEAAQSVNDTARILAGLPVESSSLLYATSQTKSWQHYAAQLERSFSTLEERELKSLRLWAEQELDASSASFGPVFYPFSGPDLVYLLKLFPNAQSYVLTGLEPVGNFPDLTAIDVPALDRRLRALSGTLYALLEFSFFRTNDMTANLKGQQVAGVLPVLMLFLERMDRQILAVDRFVLSAEGLWCKTTAADGRERALGANDLAGVRIHFIKRGEKQVRHLIYFQADIGNPGLKRTPQYADFIDALAPKAAMLKAASYLQHKDYFSEIAALTMRHAELLVQDDSGIPHRKFSSQDWQATAFGSYSKPIPLFANWFQRDLLKLYQLQKPRALDFSFGYTHRNSGLVRYQRISKPTIDPPGPIDSKTEGKEAK